MMYTINKRNRVREVGRRKERPISSEPSGDLLLHGAIFNDEMHKAFGTKDNGVPKGVYHFNNHAEANEHIESCIAKKMARRSLGR